ncbi:Flp family type IVb pilin [Aureimonas sp. ME7]|uniref:Flp family type IVb pilin n=1 Tax=Aureimonas sp. ME7 TaxID=2744252 RepID=UPI0015F67E86|nr:Flp family type IVb pilin [Aureimonas sp. ME7]
MLSRLAVPARAWLRGEAGSTAIEYALIASLIGLGILGGLAGTGNSVSSAFQNLMIAVGDVLGRASV